MYPPISVEDWTVDNLSDRIAEVRQIYLDTLKSWPQDELPTFDIYTRATPAKKARRPGPRRKQRRTKQRPRRRRRRRRPRRRLGPTDGPKPDTSSSQIDPQGSTVTAGLDDFPTFSTTVDALGAGVGVVAGRARNCSTTGSRRNGVNTPTRPSRCLQLPATDEPAPGVVARLVEELESDEDRLVVPVRVFWVPAGLPTRLKVVGLISGRDTYRPPEILQRRILRKNPTRARVVAGEPAKVSELRKQWSETTVAENPREFARFVLRRAALAIERVELRLLGPNTSRRGWSSRRCSTRRVSVKAWSRFPGATVEKAGEMLDELSTGWSRFSVDLIPTLGRAIFSRGFDPRIDYDRSEIESMRHALEQHPAVLLFSTVPISTA